MSQMADPSFGVNRDLLPHVHLVSTYRYPVKATIQPSEVTSLLMQAPKIARDTAPFYWTYLDKPENGSIFLTWQPLQQMNVQFASDGYVWPPQETYYQQEVGNGVILEMYLQKTGFAYGEQYAMHSRRRFRLIPPNVPNPNAPQVDPSLWIVHYGPNEPNDRIHASQLPRDARTQQVHETRSYLHRCGQIQRKEFILGDRPNWPQIGWPREAPRQPVYTGNRGVPQSMAYPSQPPSASGPPSKRARTSQAAHAQGAPPMGALIHQDSAYDDEEDTSRGDMFDHLTPREISLHRYRQNHEWMEEIISSPYSLGQIGFADIGLGLKGELSGLTEGIFDSQDYKTLVQPSSAAPKTRLDPEQAEEFRKRVNDRISATNSEIEKMKAEHDMKLRKFKRNSVLTTSEKKLRHATDGASRDEFNLEGRSDDNAEASGRWHAKSTETVDQIIASVESQLGRHAEAVIELRRIQEGGYQEPAPEPVSEPEPVTAPLTNVGAGGGASGTNGSSEMSRQPSQAGSNHSGIMIGDTDIDMGGTAAGLLDQMYTGMSSTSTPNNNFPTPQAHLSAAHSHAATPVNVASPHALPQHASYMENADVRMGDTESAKSNEASGSSVPDQGSGSGEWVVVSKDGVTPSNSGGGVGTGMGNPDGSNDTGSEPLKATLAANTSSNQASAAGTPAEGSTTVDFVDFGSLGDLDTAGDALAGYDSTAGDLGVDLDLGTEMDI
ncbi:SWI/SNF and RSC complexes subunit Ssr4 C-terminal [Microdochium nivale]|nr:SWI/SNF and RSC complexes subunit Ssr4 C-terminal [Microdochium nivale]